MFKIPVIPPKHPDLEEIRRYELAADAPRETISSLSAALLAARAHAASRACVDKRLRDGVFRVVADTALLLAVMPSADEAEFRSKVNAMMGVQFQDADRHIARAVQLLLTIESRRLGLEIESTEIRDTPRPATLNS